MDFIKLTEMFEEAGIDFRPDYSGRAMYGRKCIAVEGASLTEVLAEVVAACEDVETAALLIRDARYDQMGLGIIIYWPSIRAPE